MEHLLDDPGNHPIKPKNDQKLCDKKEHQNSMYTDTNTWYHNYTMEGKPLQNTD